MGTPESGQQGHVGADPATLIRWARRLRDIGKLAPLGDRLRRLMSYPATPPPSSGVPTAAPALLAAVDLRIRHAMAADAAAAVLRELDDECELLCDTTMRVAASYEQADEEAAVQLMRIAANLVIEGQ